MQRADIRGADLEGAVAANSNLTEAYMCGAHLNGTDLRGADLDGAFCSGTHFIKADIRGVRHLAAAKGIEYAAFVEVIAAPDERELIEQKKRIKKAEFA